MTGSPSAPLPARRLLLLPPVDDDEDGWEVLPARLADAGFDVVTVDVGRDDRTNVARYAALAATRLLRAGSLRGAVLVVGAGAEPVVPRLTVARRAAREPLGGYVFLGGALPSPAGDWPDAPCGVVVSSAAGGDPAATIRAARLRDWPTQRTQDGDLAGALVALLALL